MSIEIYFIFVNIFSEVPSDAHQDFGRLLLLHLWSASRADRSRGSLRLHGTGHDRRHQVSSIRPYDIPHCDIFIDQEPASLVLVG